MGRTNPKAVWAGGLVELLPLDTLTPAPAGKPRGDQRWSTFLKNHADAIIACDFCVVASATFRILYVLMVMEHASRQIIYRNVTAHPTAALGPPTAACSHSLRPHVPVYPS
jgi:hypothetical protein